MRGETSHGITQHGNANKIMETGMTIKIKNLSKFKNIAFILWRNLSWKCNVCGRDFFVNLLNFSSLYPPCLSSPEIYWILLLILILLRHLTWSKQEKTSKSYMWEIVKTINSWLCSLDFHCWWYTGHIEGYSQTPKDSDSPNVKAWFNWICIELITSHVSLSFLITLYWAQISWPFQWAQSEKKDDCRLLWHVAFNMDSNSKVFLFTTCQSTVPLVHVQLQ